MIIRQTIFLIRRTHLLLCPPESTQEWESKLHDDNRHARGGGNKLRTHRLFKHAYETESYLTDKLPYVHRSAMSKFRCGVAPLKIETGRYENIPLEARICFNCNSLHDINVVESEMHVLTECSLYADLREPLFEKAQNMIPNFHMMSNLDKMCNIFKIP